MYRSYFWKRGHFLNQYTQSPEWRLLSSWGRDNTRAARSDKREQDAASQSDAFRDDWYNAWQRRHIDTLRRFEEFKKLVDEDPYKALFGTRLPESQYGLGENGDKSTSQGSPSRPNASRNATDSAKPPNQNSATPMTDDEFIIDPITMRKVPIRSQQRKPTMHLKGNSDRSWDIRVKTFKAAPGQTASSNQVEPGKTEPPAEEPARQNKPAWLVQEGFSEAGSSKRPEPPSTVENSARIESALDRYLTKPRTVSSEGSKATARLEYDPKENRDEDMDLLTASDIRAARNRCAKEPRDAAKKKEEQRQILENDYKKRPQELEEQLEKELAAKKLQAEQAFMKELEEIAEEQRKRDAVRLAHDKEVADQKAAMEAHEVRRKAEPEASTTMNVAHPPQAEGDMATNVHEFAGRDRWYKRKAPHANAEQKLSEASKDKELVREVRNIYEDTYGTIDTKHRQTSPQTPADDSEYPSNAFPGTIYEQPWTANVLNDHPDTNAQGVLPASEQSELQGQHEEQKFQALSLIGKLFSGMRENQMLLQEYRSQLEDVKTNGSQNLYQSFKAHEQRIMDTLKAAQNLFKTPATISNRENTHQGTEKGPSETIACNQRAENASSEVEDSAPVTMYKILALDPTSGKVATTKTTNLTGPSIGKPPTISEALLQLENPAKFLPHFSALQNAEYEIAVASPNLLIFKKTRQLRPAAEEKMLSEEPWNYPNPIDGTLPQPQTGNFASPTGFVNYDPPFPEPEIREQEEAAAAAAAKEADAKSKDKVRRQEDVFSGASRRPWHDEYERGMGPKERSKKRHRRSVQRRRTVRRMLLVGMLTAGGCYAVGVASEFLRI